MLGDLGWWELKARRDKARLKFFKKMKNRRHDEYTRILADDIHGVWSVFSNELLHAIEIDVVDMNLHSEREWRNLVTNRTHRKEEKRWREGLQAKAKLRTYRTIKSKLRMEPYLRFKNRLARYLITRLRSGTNVPVDTRRKLLKNGYADSATRSKMKSTFFSIVSCMLIFEARFGRS